MQITSSTRRTAVRLGAALLGLAAIATPAASAWAQAAYPAKPIRLIVPFPPGGGTDMIARAVAQKMADQNKWNVIVDNRPGAGGNLGVDAASKADPDGYTLVMGQTSNLAINPTLYKKLPYDPLKDLVPVALVSSSPIVMAVPVNSRFNTFADVVAASKSKPDTVTLGYSGNGTVAHLAGEQAQKAAGIQLRHIPYKGAAQAMTDLVGGQIDLYMSSVPTLLGQVRNGKLKVIAITSAKRSAQLPDVPTLAESGVPGFDSVTWTGFFVPAGTPEAVVQKLHHGFATALQEPKLRERFAELGLRIYGSPTAEFQALMDSDAAKYESVIQQAGIKVN